MKGEDILLGSFRGLPKPYTGDKPTDFIIDALYGDANPSYRGEIAPENPERTWCDAILSGLPLTPEDITLSGYELTHSIFYATDFGRRKKTNPLTQKRLVDLAKTETNLDLLAEYAVCMLCVGGKPDHFMLRAISAVPTDEHHGYVIELFKILNG